MKKHHFPIILLFIVGLWACEKNEKTIDQPAHFKIIALQDTVGETGNNYPVKVVLEKDTTWVYPRIKSDTVFDDNGVPKKDEFNKLIINYDTTYTAGTVKGKYVLLDTILLPALSGKHKNTLIVQIESNARWQTPVNQDGKDWLVPIIANGGGDGTATLKVDNAISRRRSTSKHNIRQVVLQTFLTRDSTVLYQLPVDQKGWKEK